MVNWKIIAITFMIITFLETSIFIWGYVITTNEENDLKECYYDICEDYPEAELINDICSCYDYTILGELEVIKQEWMK